jgi:hypothetical protein
MGSPQKAGVGDVQQIAGLIAIFEVGRDPVRDLVI